MGGTVPNPILEMEAASRMLSQAEESIELDPPGSKNYSSSAVLHASRAVLALYSAEHDAIREGILSVILDMPPRMWGEVLRLLEILSYIEEVEPTEALDMAREAVEIAISIVLTGRDEISSSDIPR